VTNVTRLILTADGSAAGGLASAGRADLVIPVEQRLVWGRLPSEEALAALLAPRTTQAPGDHWLDPPSSKVAKALGGRDLGLLDVCARFERVELWMETSPNAQLVLIWLLDYFRTHADAARNLVLCHVDATLGDAEPQELARWRFPTVGVTRGHLDIAERAWHAYRAPTPEPWFNLLNEDLSIVPQLRRCVLELLEELPGRRTGLGASEMRMLELISAGYEHPFEVFPHYRQRFQRRVFGYWEAGALLEALALAPTPAVSGLAEWPFPVEMHDLKSRYERYKASRLQLTQLGQAILRQADDFSRHNRIHRWWGGTELTNERLWRWDPVLIAPSAA
jgi:hypothetical protein